MFPLVIKLCAKKFKNVEKTTHTHIQLHIHLIEGNEWCERDREKWSNISEKTATSGII